jgi:hypothetical protein
LALYQAHAWRHLAALIFCSIALAKHRGFPKLYPHISISSSK